MGRALRIPHAAQPSYTSADALFLLRLDEAGGAVNFTDAVGGGRTMTQVNSPGAATSLFSDASLAASLGARTFNGTTQQAGRLFADGDQALFQALAWGFAGWLQVTSLAAVGVFLELGEWSSPKVAATYIQMQLSVQTDGSIRYAWHDSGGTLRNNSTAAGVVVVGKPTHFGLALEPDPNNHLQQRIRFYVNGACTSIVANRPPPFSGASTRWIVGASRDGGTAVSTPGTFFAGSLDDLVITRFSPTHEFFREVYANGASWFGEKLDEGGPAGTLGTGSPSGTLQEVHTRVLVEVSPDGSSFPNANSPLALVNLTDLNLNDIGGMGIDLVTELNFGDNIDDAGPSADITLVTRYDFWNLAPLATSSPLANLFSQRRRIKIEQAFVPVGTTRDGADPFYRLMFDGFALNPNFDPKAGHLTVLGPQGSLTQAWVEPAPAASSNESATGDRVYGSAGGIALETNLQQLIDDHDPARLTVVPATGAEGVPNGISPAGGAGTAIVIRVFGAADEHGKGRPHAVRAADSILISGTTNYNGVKTINTVTTSVLTCVDVSSSAAEQVGTVKMLPIHSYRGLYPTVWCPTSPGFAQFTFNEPPSKSVYAAGQAWTDEIGWHFRPRWDDTRKQFRFKLYDPRVTVVNARGIQTSDAFYMPDSVNLKHDFQRTAGVVEYANGTNTDNKGEKTRYCVGYGDLARNGDRYYFRVVNDSKSLVTTSAAAQTQLDILKNDLGVIDEDAVFNAPADPTWDIGDTLDVFSEFSFTPFQMPALLGFEVFPAIVGVRTTVGSGGRSVRTALTLIKLANGAVGAGAARRQFHLAFRIPPIGAQFGVSLRSPNSPAAPTVTSPSIVFGATRMVGVTWAFPVGDQNRSFDIMEVHASTSTGFTPSSSTLKGAFRGTGGTIAHGIGVGVGGFVKIVATDSNGNRSAPSAQTGFTS